MLERIAEELKEIALGMAQLRLEQLETVLLMQYILTLKVLLM